MKNNMTNELTKRQQVAAMILAGLASNQTQMDLYANKAKKGEIPLDYMIKDSIRWADRFLEKTEK